MAVAVAAVVGISQFGGRPAQNAPETTRTRAQTSPSKTKTPASPKSPTAKFDRGSCQDIEERLQAFLGVLDEDSIVAPGSCAGDGKPIASITPATRKQWDEARAPEFRCVIATMDDPIYTHFALGFDRKAEAIQQAAADAGYVYDSSWLPWDPKETNYDRIGDQDIADDRKDAREEQPGILLFRKALSDSVSKSDDPYKNGLAVFVVGDDPTDGVHRAQFLNATAWIAALKHQIDPNAPRYQLPDSILGPSFSGSLPSLAALLNDIPLGPVGTKLPPGQKLSIFSGVVTSSGSVSWLIRATKGQFNLHFASFQLSDHDALDRYCRYLLASHFELKHLAIVSEDETAFGASSLPKSCGTGQESAVNLYYPRDISALRSAYQKQSLLGANGNPSSTGPTRRTLASDIADSEGQEHDTIRTFGGDQSALSQEAVLQQIVSFLRSHESEYILLRSSNPLDQLFLSHYFRLAYAQGRVVILGADLLLRREGGSASLSGIMTLTNYPLLPWDPHWTGVPSDSPTIHSHRTFANDGTEGTYIAGRFLLNSPTVAPATVCIQVGCKFELPRDIDRLSASGYLVAEKTSRTSGFSWTDLTISSPDSDRQGEIRLGINDSQMIATSYEGSKTLEPRRGAPLELYAQFLPVGQKPPIPEYNIPFWTRTSVDCTSTSSDPCRAEPPPLWLSVLGANDFWPIAALDDRTLPPKDDCKCAEGLQSPRVWVADRLCEISKGRKALWGVFTFWEARDAYANKNWVPWPPMPSSIRLAIVCLFAWIIFHLVCCLRPSVTSKPDHRAYFVCFQKDYRTHRMLLVVGSLCLSSMATVIAWGCGAFSPDGQPFHDAIAGLGSLALMWVLAGLSLLVNLWSQRSQPGDSTADVAPNAAASDTPPTFLSFIAAWPTIWPLGAYALGTLGFYFTLYCLIEAPLGLANRFPSYWRAMNLTSGVSPLILLLAPAAGVYMWFWYALQRLAYFGPDRPRLPDAKSLMLTIEGRDLPWLRMFSHEYAAKPIEKQFTDFTAESAGVLLLFALVLFLSSAFSSGGGIPIRTLAPREASYFVCGLVVVCVSLMLANAWRLLSAWMHLRALLVYLNRLRLRRSMAAIPDVSWGSVWKLGGNVLDMRYKLLTTQFESVTHLQNSLSLIDIGTLPVGMTPSSLVEINNALSKLQSARTAFAEWYVENWDVWNAYDDTKLKRVQESLGTAAGLLLAKLLRPAWLSEAGPEIKDARPGKDGGQAREEPGLLKPVSALVDHIRYAEQFVCFVYLGFVQNSLGQMRSLVMSILWLFIAVTISMASYPFDPRPVISGATVVLFLALGAVIVLVYAQMHRDPILSLITNTKPGELGGDFWLKLVGFGAGPVIGLIATLFPQIADFAYSWLQPGVASMK
jgi:hypothetical protein